MWPDLTLEGRETRTLGRTYVHVTQVDQIVAAMNTRIATFQGHFNAKRRPHALALTVDEDSATHACIDMSIGTTRFTLLYTSNCVHCSATCTIQFKAARHAYSRRGAEAAVSLGAAHGDQRPGYVACISVTWLHLPSAICRLPYAGCGHLALQTIILPCGGRLDLPDSSPVCRITHRRTASAVPQ